MYLQISVSSTPLLACGTHNGQNIWLWLELRFCPQSASTRYRIVRSAARYTQSKAQSAFYAWLTVCGLVTNFFKCSACSLW